jgi:hypothetical protein
MIELLTVMDRFQIQRIGVLLIPDFSVPREWTKRRSEKVTVVPPNGPSFETQANFDMVHFNNSDPEASIDNGGESWCRSLISARKRYLSEARFWSRNQ